MNDIEERITSALAPYRLEDALMPGRGTLQPPPRPRLRVTLAAAAVLAVVMVALATLLPMGAGGPDPAVASLLHRFARIAQHAAAEPAPQPGQYVYTETMAQESYLYVSGDGQYRFVYSVPVTTQQWLGPDGSGRQVNTTGDQPTFPTQADRAAYQAYLASGGLESDKMQFDWGKTTVDRYGPGVMFWRDTSALPTDPVALGQLIDDRQIVGGPDGDWESFVLATDLIRDTYARPELRAALYSYMAGLSGIELVGNTTDALGRPGVGLASSHDGIRHEVIFDRTNGKILEERDVVLDPDEGVYQNPGPGEFAYANAGQPDYVATYRSFGQVVDSTTQTPPR
ncbi:MAG: CU044_5270 family protein [Actinomycetota bacterium]|nr:CU044_5270 family protein [Actinomycetota bacterium]